MQYSHFVYRLIIIFIKKKLCLDREVKLTLLAFLTGLRLFYLKYSNKHFTEGT